MMEDVEKQKRELHYALSQKLDANLNNTEYMRRLTHAITTILECGPNEVKSLGSFQEIFSYLENEKAVIDVGDYGQLKKLMNRIEHYKAVRWVEDTERQITDLNLLKVKSSSSSSSHGTQGQLQTASKQRCPKRKRIVPIVNLSDLDLDSVEEHSEAEEISNLAPGLAWSSYDGYLKIVAAGNVAFICDRHLVNESTGEKIMALDRIILLFPLNPAMQHDLELIPNICCVGKITVRTESNRGVEANRKYEVTVYEIFHDDRYYYCMITGALGIDHINKMIDNSFLPKKAKDEMRNMQYAQYVKFLEDHASNDRLMTVPEGKGDVFLFLVFNDTEQDGKNVMVEKIVEGMNRYCHEYKKSDQPRAFRRKINMAKRLQDLDQTPMVSDKMIEKILENVNDMFHVKLRGPFMEGEDDNILLTRNQLNRAKNCLEEFDNKKIQSRKMNLLVPTTPGPGVHAQQQIFPP